MSRIIITRGVNEYRQTVPQCVTKEDTVLEIGCAWGTTSARLYRHAKHLVAIDKGRSLPRARQRYPHIQFERIDGFDVDQVRGLGFNFTKIYIDISGSRELFDVMRMVVMYEAVFQPDTIVVKSTRLKRFVSRCAVWENGFNTFTRRDGESGGLC